MNKVKKCIENIIKNEQFINIMKAYLIFHCSFGINMISNQIITFLNLNIIKVIMLLLILVIAKKDVGLALLLSIVFLVNLMKQKSIENFVDHEDEEDEDEDDEVEDDEDEDMY